jgi:hypothetical protein
MKTIQTDLNLMLALLFGLLASGFSTSQSQAVLQMCGQPEELNLDIRLWETIAIQSESRFDVLTIEQSVITHDSPSITTSPESASKFPFDQMTIANGTALAALEQPISGSRRDDEKQLRIYTLEGEVFTLSDQEIPTNVRFWRLMSENELGNFSVFGYSNQGNATITQISFSEQGLMVGETQLLPFEFSPNHFYWAMLSISPDNEYISYIQERENEVGQLDYFIYDVSDNERIWQMPYNANNFASVIWIQNLNLIGLVYGMTPETTDQLIAVYTNGTSEIIADLGTTISNDTFVMPLSGVKISSQNAVFFVRHGTQSSDFTYNLMSLDLSSYELVDLCQSWAEMPTILGSIADKIVLHDTSNDQIIVISADTGDYTIVTFDERISPIPNTLELVAP